MEKIHLMISGAPRSGTSALVRFLNFDPRFLITHEMMIFHGYVRERFNHGIRQQVLREAGVNIKDALAVISQQDNLTGVEVLDILAKHSSRRPMVVGDKQPIIYISKINTLLKKFPNSKLIITLRDGRDFICSSLRFFEKSKEESHWVKSNLEDAEAFWIDLMSKMLNELSKVNDFSRLLIVRYEDVVGDKIKLAYDIQKFLGLETREIDDGGWYKPTNVYVWKKEFPDINSKLSSKCKEILNLMGYSTNDNKDDKTQGNIVTKEHVIWAYRLFLDREPENLKVVENKFKKIKSTEELRYIFINSEEFKKKNTKLFNNKLNFDLPRNLMGVSSPAKTTFKISIDEIIIVFFHIPKTAGTSFRHLVWKNLNKDEVFWHGQDNQFISSKQPKELEKFKFIGGHFGFSNNKIKTLPKKKLYISLLRKPIERVISHFNYIKQRPDHALYSAENLEETLSKTTPFRKDSENSQCRYISGKSSAKETIAIIEQHPFIIGRTDKIDVFLEKLNLVLGWNTDDFIAANVGQPGYQNNLRTEAVEKKIQEITVEDQKLINYIGDCYSNISILP